MGVVDGADYEQSVGEMASLKGVSHLVFKDLKSGADRLTFLDLLRLLLVTSNPEDARVCEHWMREQEHIAENARALIHARCKQTASQLEEGALPVYEQVYNAYNTSSSGVLSRAEFLERASAFLAPSEAEAMLETVGVGAGDPLIPFDKFVLLLLPRGKTLSKRTL